MAAKPSCAQRRAPLFALVAFALALLSFLPAPGWGASNSTIVVIDPGHGGFDRGGIPGQSVAEKTMTLDVALRLRQDLRDAGYRVIMTRDSDVFVTLGDRVRLANSFGNAIFVCIHFNSASRSGANGIETYYYSNQSAALAASIHRQVVAGTTSENRGIRRRGYFVLRRTTIPAVLVECGFLTNPTEARLALQSSYRQQLADRIANGIMDKPAPRTRPVLAGLTRVVPPVEQPFGNDFVRAEPERSHFTHHSSQSTKKSRHKKSSSSSRKKKSSTSSSKKKSSGSTKKKKSSSGTTKKKKKKEAETDE